MGELDRVMSTEEELAALRRRVAELEGELAARPPAGKQGTWRDRAEQILEAAGVIMLVVGTDQRVELVNRRGCELLGYPESEIVGSNWFDRFVPAGQREQIRAGFLEQLATQEAGQGEQVVAHSARPVLTRAGEQRLINWQAVLLRDESGKVIGALSAGMDVTETVRAQEELALSAVRLREITQNVPAVIFEVDEQGTILYANRAFEGLRVEDVIGTRLGDWFPADEWEALGREMAPALAAGETVTSDYSIPWPDGSLHHYTAHLAPLELAGGRLHVVIVAADVTGRVRAEQALRRSERQLSTMLETIDLIAVSLDPAGTITYCNDYLLRLTGRERDEVLGGNWFEIFVPPDQHELVRSGAFRPAMLNGKPAPHFENDIVTRSGERRRVAWSNTVLQDAAGTVLGSTSIGEDITERARAERALRESEARYRELYRLLRLMADNVPDMIWAKDLDRRYLFANQAICDRLLMARDTDEPLGKSDLFFARREREAHPERPDWHTFGEICADSDAVVIESRRPQRFDEYGNVRGEFLFLDVYKAPFWNEAGEMIGTVGSGRIVTREKAVEVERERIRAELEASLAEKEVLLREVHHRVKNNLQIISSLLKLQARGVDDEQVAAMLDDCQGRVRSMALVHETLHRSADLAQVDLLAYFRALGSHLFQMYRQRGQAINYHVVGEPFSLSLDAAVPCGLIVTELLSNALKHAFAGRENGQVWVLLGRDEGAYRLTVADDGNGLPAGFDFRTAESLGLQLVVTLVEQLRGSIELQAESPVGAGSGGASFLIRFQDPSAA